MKRWCIINLEWLKPGKFNGTPAHENLPERYRPGRFYQDRAVAEKELLRLRKEYRGDYFLFEAVSKAVESPVVPGLLHMTEDV